MTKPLLRIATRASRLALWQANHVAELLHPCCDVLVVNVSTVGDRDQSQSLSEMGGVGVFTREVQKAVLDDRADLAVHSLKDLPTEIVPGLTLAAVPKRGPVADALVLPANVDTSETDQPGDPLARLAENAHIGTDSLRRRAQLLHQRADLQMQSIRGNVETRLKKLDEGAYDALILATAGLNRLDLAERISYELNPPVMFPAVGQGALGLECRADDTGTIALLETISDAHTLAAVKAERTLLAELRAGCHAPLGVVTGIDGEEVTLTAVVLSTDGQQRIEASSTANIVDAAQLGNTVAQQLIEQGAEVLIQLG